MEEVEVFGTLVVGICLCFFGVHTLGSYVRLLLGNKMRTLAAKFPPNLLRDLPLGFLYSALSGNSRTLSLMVSSWSSSRVVPYEKSLTLLTWGNVGALSFLFLAIMSLKIAFIFTLAIVGSIYMVKANLKPQNILGALAGVVLVYYGSHVIRGELLQLLKEDWYLSYITYLRGDFLFAFFAGVVFILLLPMPLLLLILAVTVTSQELLPPALTLTYSLGIFVGTVINNWNTSKKTCGATQYIALHQALFFLSVTLICGFLLIFEQLLNFPFASWPGLMLTNDSAGQMIITLIFYHLLVALVLTLFTSPINAALKKFFPDKEKAHPSEPQYINQAALSDPESAMDLVETEQFRLISRLPSYIEALRSDDVVVINPTLKQIHMDFETVSNKLQDYLTTLSPKEVSKEAFERYLNLMHRQNILNASEQKIFAMCQDISQILHLSNIKELLMRFVEAVDTILLMIRDSIDSLNAGDIDLLYAITYNREDQMREIRATYLSHENSLQLNERSKLLGVIVAFEKSIWLTRQLSTLLKESQLFTLEKASTSDHS